jgi:hypothetical protein
LAEAVETRAKKVGKKKGPRAAAVLLANFEGRLRTQEGRFARADKAPPAVARGFAVDSAFTATMSAGSEPVMMKIESAALMIETSVSESDEPEQAETPEPMHEEDDDRDEKEDSDEHPLARNIRKRVEKIERARIAEERKEIADIKIEEGDIDDIQDIEEEVKDILRGL